MKVHVVTKEEIKPWCFLCGRVVDKVVEVPIPCPWCTTDVRVRMCLDCARKLKEELEKAIQDAA